eukprot:679151-Amorphochlora_amoeboformis.AAC.2
MTSVLAAIGADDSSDGEELIVISTGKGKKVIPSPRRKGKSRLQREKPEAGPIEKSPSNMRNKTKQRKNKRGTSPRPRRTKSGDGRDGLGTRSKRTAQKRARAQVNSDRSSSTSNARKGTRGRVDKRSPARKVARNSGRADKDARDSGRAKKDTNRMTIQRSIDRERSPKRRTLADKSAITRRIDSG